MQSDDVLSSDYSDSNLFTTDVDLLRGGHVLRIGFF